MPGSNSSSATSSAGTDSSHPTQALLDFVQTIFSASMRNAREVESHMRKADEWS